MINPINFRHKLHNNTHRYFFSIFFTSLLSFGLIAVILFLAAYINYKWDNRIKSARDFDIEKNNAITHTQIMYAKITTIAHQLSTDTRLRRWILFVPGYDDLLSLQSIFNSLQSVTTADDDIQSIDIIDTRRKVILSTRFGYRTPEQGSTYEILKEILFSKFLLASETSSLVRIPENLITDTSSLLSYIISIPEGNKLAVMSVTFKLERFLPANAGADNRIWAISDESGIILSNRPELAERFFTDGEIKVQKTFPSPSDPSELYYNSKKYWYSIAQIIDGSYSMKYAVPIESLETHNLAIVRHLPLMVVLVLLLSVSASFLLYSQARRPIIAAVRNAKRIMNMPDSDPKNHTRKGDAITDLNQTLKTIILHTQSTERIISENKDFFHENALRNLLFGRQTGYGRSFYEMKFLRPNNNNFLVLVFRIEVQEDKENQRVTDQNRIIHEAFENIIGKYTGGIIKTGHHNWTALLNLKSIEEKKQIMKSLIVLQETISDNKRVVINAGLSSLVRRPEEIPGAYTKVFEGLRSRSLINSDSIIDTSEIKDKNTRNFFSIKDGQNLIKELRIQNKEQIVYYVENMIKRKIEAYSPELLHAYFLYLYSCAAKVATEYNLSPEVLNIHTASSVIENLEPLDKKIKKISQLCLKIVECRESEQKRFKILSLEIVLNYINENYTNPISLSIIAADLHVSVSYLSELLKKALGMNYIQYVNKLRIEKSLIFLKDENLTVKKISHLVGYDSEHSFIRNFKRHFGRTPTDFRNRNDFLYTIEKTNI